MNKFNTQKLKSDKLEGLFDSIDYKYKFKTSRGVLLLCNDLTEIPEEFLDKPILHVEEEIKYAFLDIRKKRKPIDFNEIKKMHADYLSKASFRRKKNHDSYLKDFNRFHDKLKFYSYESVETLDRYYLKVALKNKTAKIKSGVCYFLIVVLKDYDLSKFFCRERFEKLKDNHNPTVFEHIYYEIPEEKEKAA